LARAADGFAVWRRAIPKRASIAPGDFASHVTLLYICCRYIVAAPGWGSLSRVCYRLRLSLDDVTTSLGAISALGEGKKPEGASCAA
jgi:hypothetical protein